MRATCSVPARAETVTSQIHWAGYCSGNTDDKHTFIFRVIQPWRWRQYFSPKRWHLPTSLHGAKTQKNILLLLLLTTARTSYFTLSGCDKLTSSYVKMYPLLINSHQVMKTILFRNRMSRAKLARNCVLNKWHHCSLIPCAFKAMIWFRSCWWSASSEWLATNTWRATG
jgi:hypothetical protein